MATEIEIDDLLHPKPRRPNVLTDLVLREVSLVDRPSNPGARVALFKRDSTTDDELDRLWKARYGARRKRKKDDPGTQNVNIAADPFVTDPPPWSDRKEKPMRLREVLKSASRTREQIAAAVRIKATKVAKREGISIERAEATIWNKRADARQAYDAAPLHSLNTQKHEPR